MPGDDRPVTFALNGGPGARQRLSQLRRHRPQASSSRQRGRQPLRSRRFLPTIRAPGSTSPTWSSSIPIGTGFSRAWFPRTRPRSSSTAPSRHRISLARHLRLAGEERPPGVAQISRRRELRRLPRSAHHLLSAIAARRGHERRGAGVAVSESDHRAERRPLADSVDGDAAVHHRRASRAPAQAHARGHGRRDRLHQGEYATTLHQGPLRPGCDRRDDCST